MSNPNQLFTNNAVTLLAAAISAGDTSLTVMSGYGQLFPMPVDVGDFFLVTLEDQAGTTREIIRVTGRTGDVFTGLIRAQEGTTAQAWSASLGSDTLVDHRVTAETMRQALLLPAGGSDVWDAPFTLSYALSTTIVQLSSSFVPGTTRVWVGGLRQKRGIDYTETSPSVLTLNFVVSPDDITEGTNITVDFSAT